MVPSFSAHKMDERFEGYKNILFFVLVLLFGPAQSIQSRSVNLALETSFLFDPQDIKENATFINKVQNVLDKLKTVLNPTDPAAAEKPVFRQNENKESEKTVLTKFLSQIGSTLIKFDDDDIRKFSKDLKDAVLKLAEKNKEFVQLFPDERLQEFIKNSVIIWAKTDPIVLKLEIAKFIIRVDTDAVIDLFKILNKVFDSSDEAKFKKLSKKFMKSTKTNDYKKFLTKAIDFVVFKRFRKLNFLLKHIIKEELRKFTEYVSKNYRERTFDNNYRRFSVTNVDKEEKQTEKNEEEDEGSSESDEKEEKRSRASDSFEKQIDLVIDKNLRMNVRNDDKTGISLNIN